MDPVVLVVLACIFGVFMAWGIGANDVANAMGPSVGSGAISLKQAVLIAAVFEFAGAFLAGGHVTQTIRKGIIDPGAAGSPDTLAVGMLAALLAAGCWLFWATRSGWPVSTTHSIVGAIVGFALVTVGPSQIEWATLGSVAVSWVVCPLLAGTASYGIYRSIRNLILEAESPIASAHRYLPAYLFSAGFFVALVTLLKGIRHLDVNPEPVYAVALAVVAGVGLTVLGIGTLIRTGRRLSGHTTAAALERLFGVLMLITACAMAFAHGSNDVANAVGPVAAVLEIVDTGGDMNAVSRLSPWILLLGAGGIVVGLLSYGHRVIATVGSRITPLTPSRGFAASLAAAATVSLASATGMPISTTHALVGAVLGVGLATGTDTMNWSLIRTIVASWLITVPAGAALAVGFFYTLRGILV